MAQHLRAAGHRGVERRDVQAVEQGVPVEAIIRLGAAAARHRCPQHQEQVLQIVHLLQQRDSVRVAAVAGVKQARAQLLDPRVRCVDLRLRPWRCKCKRKRKRVSVSPEGMQGDHTRVKDSGCLCPQSAHRTCWQAERLRR